MSERDDDPAANAGQPLTTGEFRVVPDVSANTAQFRAFAQRPAGEAEVAGRNTRRLAGIVVLILIAVVVLVILAVTL